jgi:hypothetical protein
MCDRRVLLAAQAVFTAPAKREACGQQGGLREFCRHWVWTTTTLLHLLISLKLLLILVLILVLKRGSL